MIIYEIQSKQLKISISSSYEAHGVKKGERIGFKHNGNFLIGKVVGCGPCSLLIAVDALSY